MNVHELRQQAKHRHAAFRDKARAVLQAAFSGEHYRSVNVTLHANVQEDIDRTGAFVECTIWIPAEEIDVE